MKRVFFLAVVALLSGQVARAQDTIYTKTGTITFFSDSPMEDITAVNKKITCVINKKSGAVEFAVLMKAFEFEKALMEEHFNENYVESDKYPKATFKGKIDNMANFNFDKDGTYEVKVTGDLTIHGVTKHVTIPGKFTVQGGKITGKSEFHILLSDYNISIPSVVKDNLSNDIKVTVDVALVPFVK